MDYNADDTWSDSMWWGTRNRVAEAFAPRIPNVTDRRNSPRQSRPSPWEDGKGVRHC
jgi:hypothetical protein